MSCPVDSISAAIVAQPRRNHKHQTDACNLALKDQFVSTAASAERSPVFAGNFIHRWSILSGMDQPAENLQPRRAFTLIELLVVRKCRRAAFTLIELPVVRKCRRAAFTLIELPVVRKCRRAAFTLIELLVVIAIIALLVSILLPSLRKSMELAKRSVCGANEHHIYTAMNMYLGDNSNLPPLTRQLDVRIPIRSDRDLLAPWYLAPVIYHINAPGGTEPSQFTNFGKLYETGYADDIKLFYCPSQTHDEFSFSTDVNPWPVEEPRRLHDATFKSWNDTFASYARRLGLTFIAFDDVPPSTAIVTDVAMFPAYTQTHHNNEGFNVLRTDGSVEFISDPWFHEDLPEFETYDFYDAVRHCLEGFERLDR